MADTTPPTPDEGAQAMTHSNTFCGHCGNANATTSQFCLSCGRPLTMASPNVNHSAFPQAMELPKGPAIPAFAGGQASMATSVKSGNRSLIAILLGVLGLFLCGPLTTVPGAILAWMDLNEAKQQGQPTPGLATIALWANIVLTVVAIGGSVIVMFMMMLMSGI